MGSKRPAASRSRDPLGPVDEVFRDWVDAFNRADIDALADFYAEDAIDHQVAESPVQGREAIRQMFATGFATAKMVSFLSDNQQPQPLKYALPASSRVLRPLFSELDCVPD